MYKILLFLSILFIFIGCTSYLSPQERYANSLQEVQKSQWKSELIKTQIFTLQSFYPINHPKKCETLSVFIEGDGFAWVTRNQPSQNPTPINPIALKIALNLGKKDSAYLSRPCQNVFNDDFNSCQERYWADDRFSDEVIASMDNALSQLKQSFGAKKIELIGYSGGGVIALLLANKRDDIVKITTVASNIDTDAWVKYHNISPLHVSNPALLWKKLQEIPQIHYVGGNDSVVPSLIAKSYQDHFDANRSPQIKIIDNYTHQCCWEDTKSYW